MPSCGLDASTGLKAPRRLTEKSASTRSLSGAAVHQDAVPKRPPGAVRCGMPDSRAERELSIQNNLSSGGVNVVRDDLAASCDAGERSYSLTWCSSLRVTTMTGMGRLPGSQAEKGIIADRGIFYRVMERDGARQPSCQFTPAGHADEPSATGREKTAFARRIRPTRQRKNRTENHRRLGPLRTGPNRRRPSTGATDDRPERG